MKIVNSIFIVIFALGAAGCDYCYLANQKHDYDLAIKECTDQVNSFFIFRRSSAIAYSNRGNAYKGKGLCKEAVADHSKAIELDPKLALAYNNRGSDYMCMHEYELALADFNSAIALDPEFELAFTNRGVAYFRSKRFDEAIADLNKIISISPKNALAYGILGSIYTEQGKYELALDDFNKSIALNPEDSRTFDARGNLYLRTGRYNKAAADYIKALTLNPKNASPYYNMACLSSLNNDVDEACNWFNKSIELGFNDWDLIKNDAYLANIRNASCYQAVMSNK